MGLLPLSDLLAQFLSGECEHLHEDLSYEEICFVETREWRIALGDSSTYRGGGA